MWIAVACVFCLIVCSASWANTPCMQVNWEKLDLSEEQRSSINNCDGRWRDVVNEVKPRIDANERKLSQLLMSPNPSESEVLRLQQAIHNDKARLKMQATMLFMNKRKVLTPPQQNRLMDQMNQH